MKALGSKYSLAAWLEGTVRVLWAVGWIALVVVVVSQIAFLLSGAAGRGGAFLPLEVVVSGGPESSLDLGIGVRSNRFEEAGMVVTEGVIHFRPGSRLVHAATVLPAVVVLALGLVVLDRLKGFIGTLREGRPFQERNGRRLRTIGLAVVGTWVLEVGYSVAFHAYARQHFELEDGAIGLGIEPALPRLFVALMLLVIAEVFRIGARLQAEQDATI
jgi:hypothetical protein